jgi:ribose 1,5-bisphosphokinase
MAKIIYLIGSSGSGKDTLIQGVRARELPKLEVAHRYITRDWHSGGENHIELSINEFKRRQQLGAFSLSWSANENCYGIGSEITHWLSCNQHVLLNGSRGYLAQAQALFPNQIQPVMIDVSAEKLRQRLINRARESNEQIDKRIARHLQFSTQTINGLQRIDNDHDVKSAIDQLCNIINNLD